MQLILYRVLWLLATPLTLVWSVQQMIRRGGGSTYLLERYAFLKRSEHRNTTVWFHAASVGEMRLATPLINAVLEHGVLVTCNTPEAYRLALATWDNALTVAYCPLDFRQCVRRFLKSYCPSLVFVIETEVWPELYEQCHQQDIPIYIVNGRISDKTFASVAARQWLYPMALGQVAGVWAREAGDAERFAHMGCPGARVHTVGSMKMTRRHNVDRPANPLPNRGFTLAISTHAGEEALLADIWQRVAGDNLLVLIPRHPPRAASIVDTLEAQGFTVARSSQRSDPTSAIDVLVVDMVGEVDAYCAHANFVFVGGSMIDAGGHNVFEPASWGKAIIVGPYTRNFCAEVEYLSDKGAITITPTKEALAEAWEKLTKDLRLREALERRTREAHAALPDKIGDYIALVEKAVATRI